MRILIVAPGTELTLTGNWHTAGRWRAILAGLGHEVAMENDYDPARNRCDLLVTLHARRSHDAVARFHKHAPAKPIVVALTGTDLYRDIERDAATGESLAIATRIVVLQRGAYDVLPRGLHAKVRVIYQSAMPAPRPAARDPSWFVVSVIANLRPEKDPLLPARAARLLEPASRVRVVLIGAALSPDAAHEALSEQAANPRLEWRGFLPHDETLAVLAASDLVAIPSLIEGGSNVLSEALVSGVPVVLTRIPGLVGTVGPDYPGLFEPGDAAGLARLFGRCEGEARFLAGLREIGARLRPVVDPESERQAWSELVAEFRGR